MYQQFSIPEMIDGAKNKGIEAGIYDEETIDNYFHVADAGDMPFEDNSFDIVSSSYALQYNAQGFDHCREVEKILLEFNRVLKDEGLLCISDGRRDLKLGGKIIFQIAKLFISKQISYYWKTSIMAGYTPSEIKEILDQTNLRDKYKIKTDFLDITIYRKNK